MSANKEVEDPPPLESSFVKTEEKKKKKKKLTKAGRKKLRQEQTETFSKHRRIIASDKTAGDLQLERDLFGGEAELVETFEKKAAAKREFQQVDDESEDDDESGIAEDEIPEKKRKKKNIKKPVWVDEDDEKTELGQVVNAYTRGKHQKLEGSKHSYKNYVEKRFESVYGSSPDWAKVKADDAKDEDDPLLMRSTVYLDSKRDALPAGDIRLEFCAELNSEQIEGSLQAVQFHPWSQVALVAGTAVVVSLYQVTVTETNCVFHATRSIRFKSRELRSATFSANGNEILVGGGMKSRNLFVFDMLSGETKTCFFPKDRQFPCWQHIAVQPDGEFIVGKGYGDEENCVHFISGSSKQWISTVRLSDTVKAFCFSPCSNYLLVTGGYGDEENCVHFISGSSKQWISTVRLSDTVKAFCFSPCSNYLLVTGDGGYIHVVDARLRRCVKRYNDSGSLVGTAIAFSPCGNLLAVGNDSGVVNIYNAESLLNDVSSKNMDPEPMKTIMNLVTTVDILKFNHSSEILAMASSRKENAVKLWHVRSRTAFKNFPAPGKNYGKIMALDFSLHSGFLSFANNKWKAKLFRIPFYPSF
ncbi:unnamed protein product [Notodromas monacha]|nr:unnamed protein product [Notodromas monacha]CAG0914716.1 unnamed protein product [Notodromas monacha]